MNTSERMQEMRYRLEQTFSPSHLEIIDDSHKHVGHEGSKDGAGHYTLIITSEALRGLSRISAHQAIYKVLNDLIPIEIHALQIKIV